MSEKFSQKKISFSGALLFPLVIFFIMNYRLGPGETPYWLFGLIFFFILFYLLLDLFAIKNDLKESLKSFSLWIIVFLVLGSALVSAIIVRHQTAPVYNIHDIILQLEAAIQFFLQGKNPYSESYFGTPLEQWFYSTSQVNPALYHFVMLPWYFLFSLPFYFLSTTIFGFFDGRLPLAFLFFILLVLIFKMKNMLPEKRRLFLILMAFNPATLGYFLEGRSDFFMFTFLFISFILLEKQKYFLSGISMALAFATKQSAWMIFPFYLAFLYFNNKENLFRTAKNISSFVLVFLIIILPFFLWDKKAFLDSTVFYLSGNTSYSYPVSGYGWGKVLNEFGYIKDVSKYYPFWIWQLAIGGPLLIILLSYLKRNKTVKNLILFYGVFTFVFWYFSRYFNNSHLGFLSSVFLSAYFWPDKNEKR